MVRIVKRRVDVYLINFKTPLRTAIPNGNTSNLLNHQKKGCGYIIPPFSGFCNHFLKGRLFLWLKQQNDLTEDFNVRFISAGSTAKDNIKSCTEKPKRKLKRKSEKSKTNLTEELTLLKAQRLLLIA